MKLSLQMAHSVCPEISNALTIESATVAVGPLEGWRAACAPLPPAVPSAPYGAPSAAPPVPYRLPCPLRPGPRSCLWQGRPAIPRGPSCSQREKLGPVRQSDWLKVTQPRAWVIALEHCLMADS